MTQNSNNIPTLFISATSKTQFRTRRQWIFFFLISFNAFAIKVDSRDIKEHPLTRWLPSHPLTRLPRLDIRFHGVSAFEVQSIMHAIRSGFFGGVVICGGRQRIIILYQQNINDVHMYPFLKQTVVYNFVYCVVSLRYIQYFKIPLE